MSGNTTIACCAAAQRADALRILHAGLSDDQKEGLLEALHAVRSQGEVAFEGLLVATADGAIIGAIWAQCSAGQTAVVWLPDVSNPAAAELMAALVIFLDQKKITLAQFLISPGSTIDPDLLAIADIHKLAKLAYLTVDCRRVAPEQPAGRLSFSAPAGENPGRLGDLLFRTYEGSHDCPQLNGLRSSSDVLEGYREQGNYLPQRWFFVQQQDCDVGTLILTEHPGSGNWELVYMGLVPEARGAGLGREILEYAMWQACMGGAERLVLAVDEANGYALEMYERAGFVAWDYRTVYARLRT